MLLEIDMTSVNYCSFFFIWTDFKNKAMISYKLYGNKYIYVEGSLSRIHIICLVRQNLVHSIVLAEGQTIINNKCNDEKMT